jgi:hypothetical protein
VRCDLIGELVIGNLSTIELSAIFNEISIMNHFRFDDPPTSMSHGMKPDYPMPANPECIWNWTLPHLYHRCEKSSGKTNNQIGICFFQNKKKKWGSHQAHEL